MFILQSEKWRFRLLAFAPDGRTLAAAAHHPGAGRWSVWHWDVPTRRARIIHEWDGGVSCLAVTADGTGLAAAGYGSIRLWDLGTGKERWNLPPARHVRVRGLVPSADGRNLLAAFGDAHELLRGSGIELRMLDPRAGQGDKIMRLPFRNYARAGAVCPTGPQVAVAVGPGARYEVNVYGPTGAHTRISLPRHTTCRRLTFAPDGRALAIISERLLRVWDLSTGRTLTTEAEKRGITAAAFSPDGRTLATANNDGTVKLFDAATGNERAAFDWRLGPILALAFAPDGMTAAAAGERGIVLWDLDV